MATARRTAIRAGWIIAFDGEEHRLLRGGVTTVLDIGRQGEAVAEHAEHFGIRVYEGLTFRSGRWLTRDGRRVVWEWDEEAGREGMRRAARFMEKHDGAHGDFLRACIAP